MSLLLPIFVWVLFACTQADTKIVSTPDGTMGPEPCIRTCSGADKNYYGWSNQYGIVSKKIDMSECDFASPPVVAAVSGSGAGKDMLCPSINVPDLKSDEFTLYSSSFYTADIVKRNKCIVYWTATGFIC